MQEETLRFTSQDGTRLEGTFVMPEAGAEWLALLHQGSTLGDRDGNVARIGMGSTLYRKVARMLAQRGIASFRYDKRQHDIPAPKPLTYSLTNRVEDYQAALASAREKWQGKVAMVGHSEGGVIAQLAAARGQEADALVVLASPAVSMTSSMRWRGTRMLKGKSESSRNKGAQMLAALEEIERRAEQGYDFTPEEFESFRDWHYTRGGLQGWEAWPWLKEHHLTDLLKEIAALRAPTLHVHGDHDTTVSLESLELYRQAAQDAGRDNVECVEMAGLGHFLEDSTRKAFVVKDEVIELVTDWLKGL